MPMQPENCAVFSKVIADRKALILVLLLALPLQCLAGELTSSVSDALDRIREHQRITPEQVSLPGQRGWNRFAPQGSPTRCNLQDATLRIATDCEQLLISGSIAGLLACAGVDSVFSPQAVFPRLPKCTIDSLQEYIPGGSTTINLLAGASRELLRAFSLLSYAERAELRELVIGFEFWRDQWPDYPVERMLELANRVDCSKLASAAAMLAHCAGTIRESGPPTAPLSEKQLVWNTPLGEVVIGTEGNDTYLSPALLIIEPGGNDTYQFPSVRWPSVNMVIDLGGDDSYDFPDGSGSGGAVMGASWLEDAAGDDTYSAGPFSQGCGVLGVGVLIDREGDDRYQGEYLCQGASFYGFGVLIDLTGDDLYEADFGAQGSNFAAGRALLADLKGDDFYHAGGRFRDWRSPGATKSFAQGCAAGIRPFAGGGRAVLFDSEGSDSLEISYLGQGAGYWGGYGLLFCNGGDDVYRAERYAQGCGLHFSTGALVDLSGGDSYALEGVGQGAGEDRAWGFLLEMAGDDSYNSVRLARGAGGTGGVGLLLELAGDDTYSPAKGQLTGGAGSKTWELPGMGFMLDMSGSDTYGGIKAVKHSRPKNFWGTQLDY